MAAVWTVLECIKILVLLLVSWNSMLLADLGKARSFSKNIDFINQTIGKVLLFLNPGAMLGCTNKIGRH